MLAATALGTLALAWRFWPQAGRAIAPAATEISSAGRTAEPARPQENGLTNEVLHRRLQKEAEDMGIRSFASGSGDDSAPAPMKRATRIAQTRAYARAIAAARQAMAEPEAETVPLSGRSPALLARPKKTGAPAGELAWAGAYGGANPAGTRTISDASAWAEVWQSLSWGPLPEVDFSRYEVVAVFLGSRPSGGSSARITAIAASEAEIVVHYKEVPLGAGTAPEEGETAPFSMRAIARSALPVRFTRDD